MGHFKIKGKTTFRGAALLMSYGEQVLRMPIGFGGSAVLSTRQTGQRLAYIRCRGSGVLKKVRSPNTNTASRQLSRRERKDA